MAKLCRKAEFLTFLEQDTENELSLVHSKSEDLTPCRSFHCVCYVALVILVKLYGLRTFAKMSSFDFGVTIAIGSLFAATIVSKEPPVAQGLVAIATLLVLQAITARGRASSDTVEDAVDNERWLGGHSAVVPLEGQ